ncbi:MAG: single-stranded DNA-binding protein [Microbacterium sp.]|uniref:single-stranded DNA-binding protein n=1 Tax=unclassified Microbacterium TaxID=2609290 RepID=UPI000C3793B5|nr:MULTISPECIES: single-stranded DNA-binding protein [unclassified Microbacterium]MAY51463.1 single-stranded DNA-binding protein [Microbacterium sp.]HAS31757.1 single-stranded DNA-binding protein [Microbacterium sp.]|tara:strand:- start:5994 stop:6467 length:474 start_codon:yes stop_codon:yes gene_type:complete
MAIRTQQSLTGFIATDPQLTYTEKGEARFYARVGQENYRRETDGSFTKLEPDFHNLVIYRASAERAYERFAKGDSFVAEGYAHEYSYTRDGQQIEGEEFVAKKIGHDTARTTYEVARTRREEPTVERAAERDGPARNATAPSRASNASASRQPALGL